MTSAEVRQSFLDFFKSKQHTIVPSSSLMPDSPNLLFTNAGMNQFVPIFLGQRNCPYTPGRAADTQKCIRAGGKHNDLEDVGLDTYHHTFFEMLGNWSFGDYFKKESIEWGWELLTKVWKFPASRLYATVYKPDPAKGDPASFDQEAFDIWAEIFKAEGLDPAIHIVFGNKKDNFWMMGDTGPCGPCSEIHVDLTPGGDTRGMLVNKSSAECIEIWNHVFIQFNANADGSFVELPARHVDTGMGFERVAGIMQCTKKFTDFSRPVSNYESDVFRPIFDELQRLSGKRYTSTLPAPGTNGANEQEKIDVAFRVIADHIRTLGFAIADGILPGNTDRNYVLRRIHRRMTSYARTVGISGDQLIRLQNSLVDTLANEMGEVFPEIRQRGEFVKEALRNEANGFNRTVERGISLDQEFYAGVCDAESLLDGYTKHKKSFVVATEIDSLAGRIRNNPMMRLVLAYALGNDFEEVSRLNDSADLLANRFLALIVADDSAQLKEMRRKLRIIPGTFAFKLYDTYGFPLDLTELLSREKGLVVDTVGFEKLMEEQRARARAAQKKTVIEVSQIKSDVATKFIGYDALATDAKVMDVVDVKGRTAVILDVSPCYAEMGGQIGDTGEISLGGNLWRVTDTQKVGNAYLHFIEGGDAPATGAEIRLAVDTARRSAIQRHHTVTHMMHWALHEVVSKDASQKGSSVTPDKLTFDFNSAALTPTQIADIERLVNQRILENSAVNWQEMPLAEIKGHKEIQQFFGEKYGDIVRVVQIGGKAGALDGWSMELCGGTHARATGEIGIFRIVAESSIAAGIRRIEAVCGMPAFDWSRREHDILQSISQRLSVPANEVSARLDMVLDHVKKLEKEIKARANAAAMGQVDSLVASAKEVNGKKLIAADVGELDSETMRNLVTAVRAKFPSGLIVLAAPSGSKVQFIANADEALVKAGVHCGKLIGAVAKIAGGGGGGKPHQAEAGGKDVSKVAAALAEAAKILGG